MAYYDFKTAGGGSKAYYLGTLAHGATMDVSAKYADYANLTATNFLAVAKSQSTSASAQSNTNNYYTDHFRVETFGSCAFYAPTISYNPANGQLSFSSTLAYGTRANNKDPIDGDAWNDTGWGNSTVGVSADIYLVTEIETL